MFNIEKSLSHSMLCGSSNFHLECRIFQQSSRRKSLAVDMYNCIYIYMYVYRNIISIKMPIICTLYPHDNYLLVKFISSSSRARPFRWNRAGRRFLLAMTDCTNGTRSKQNHVGLSENVVYPIPPNGFADHYPVFKWLAIIGNIYPTFSDKPM